MAVWQQGDESESVAKIQRWLFQWYQSDPSRYANPGPITGVFTAETAAALRTMQSRQGVAATGIWDIPTANMANAMTRYVTGGASSDPFAGSIGTQTIAGDRQYVIEQYQALFGRVPSAADLERHVSYLQQGQPRATWVANLQTHDSVGSVTRIFQDMYGRAPTAAETERFGNQLKSGQMTIEGLRSYIAGTAEYLTRPAAEPGVTGEQEDARAYVNGLLDQIGLGSLKDWAWQMIQQGYSPVRIQQELRTRPEYQARFAGIAQLVENGLPAITEAEYLAWESSANQIMRAAGLPAGFYDDPADYATLIGRGVSISELNERVQDGFVRVNQAAPEIRNQFAEWYGPSGDSALAAFMLDPDRATPVLRRMIATAEVGGVGDQFGRNFTMARAGQIADTGIDARSARAGMAQLASLDPLFGETVSESLDLTAEQQGADAVFQLGGNGQRDLEQRGRTRVAATSGGGGANIDRTGIAIGAAD